MVAFSRGRWRMGILGGLHTGIAALSLAHHRAASCSRQALRTLGTSSHRRAKKAPADQRGPSDDVSRIRNIGVMAHIDAGKTTTTERMLFYSGQTRHIGNVDDGDTQMDFLPEERERGITIMSAATTFPWKGHRINLVDTPGHVDFTMEVERALRVMDGAVAVFDASKGVEAQTMTVWRQALRHSIPTVAFVNKMDKPGATLDISITTMQAKLGIVPLILQQPRGSGHTFEGVVDLIDLHILEWNAGDEGQTISRKPLETDDTTYDEAVRARGELIETLSTVSDDFAEFLLEEEEIDYAAVDPNRVRLAVRQATIARAATPVLCGAAQRNIGVQPVIDAVADYLPSPLEGNPVVLTGASDEPIVVKPTDADPLCALAFKISHDAHRGAVTFVRVYSGTLRLKETLYNSSRQKKERINKLLQIYANHYNEVDAVTAGNVAAVVGLKETFSGDTLVAERGSLRQTGGTLLGIEAPPAVFTRSVECQSGADQKLFEQALRNLLKEDPSIRLTEDEDTGQTLLSGMGELHLEVACSQLQSKYKLDIYSGPMQVAYKETPGVATECRRVVDVKMGGESYAVEVDMAMAPAENERPPEILCVPGFGYDPDQPPETPQEKALAAAVQGASAGASQGAVLSFPLVGCTVRLERVRCGDTVPLAAVAKAVATAVKEMTAQSSPRVIQPVMALEVQAGDEDVGVILTDLTSERHAQVQGVELQDEFRVVKAEVPLSTMVGYARILRQLTSGRARFTMEFSRYEPLSDSQLRVLAQ